MTFKHTKNWDSEVMRSLEKVAYEKGLVKPEPLPQKTASVIKKADVTPTSDLMANIFKLCVALRAEGFVKEANDVEVNYLNYKRAQTLYEAFKEKGEDVIHDAHSEGSHKLEGVDGDEAVVEDILDKHEKIMKAVEKKPTGKLSSNKDILNAVKVTLGAGPLALRKDKSSDPRSYLSKTSLGQEATTKSDSGIGGPVAGGVATGVAIVGIQQAIRILNNWRVGYNINKAEAAIEFLVKMAPKNPTALRWVLTTLPRLPVAQSVPAAAQAVTTVAKVAGPAAEKIMLEGALETGARMAPGAIEAAAPTVGAAEAGTASWLTEVWVGAAGLGDATVGVGAGAAGVGATAGGVALATVPGIITYFILKYVFGEVPDEIRNIGEAGDKVLSDLEFMKSDFNEQDKEYFQQFSNVLSNVKKLLPSQEKFRNPSKEDVMKLLNFSDLLGESTTVARNIWGSATAHIDDQFGGRFRGFSNVKLHTQNYIDAANKIRDAIIKASQQFRAAVEKKLAAQSAASGGADKLVQGYQNALSTISKYDAIIKAKRLPNAQQLSTWLGSMKEYLSDEVKEFTAVDPTNRAAVAKEYIVRLKAATDRLDAFQKALPQ